MDLVERDAILETLRARLSDTASGGHTVLVAGEAGIGKTSVLRALAATHPTVWWGACDALETPIPLAPLLDIARHADASLRGAPGGRAAGPFRRGARRAAPRADSRSSS